jgi:hypothetical protein
MRTSNYKRNLKAWGLHNKSTAAVLTGAVMVTGPRGGEEETRG